MTIAEKLHERKAQLADARSISEAMEYQEIAYRLYVLDVMKRLSEAIPETQEPSEQETHYQLMTRFLHGLVNEQDVISPPPQTASAERECAKMMLINVLTDGVCRMQGNTFLEPSGYQLAAKNLLQTTMVTWIAYRESLISVLIEN